MSGTDPGDAGVSETSRFWRNRIELELDVRGHTRELRPAIPNAPERIGGDRIDRQHVGQVKAQRGSLTARGH